MTFEEEQVNHTPAAQRVLLLPHCLRHAESCKATYDAHGLQCARCREDCAVNLLTARAKELGYLGVCVAPGGRLAVNFIREARPRAVVAVACAKELMEGVQGVQAMAGEAGADAPAIVVVPLSKDGCVNTEVDIARALATISAGCEKPSTRP
jgi:geranylgeranyl diphosphate synthase type II